MNVMRIDNEISRYNKYKSELEKPDNKCLNLKFNFV